MTHFTDIELNRWRDSGPGVDHERVVAHLAACAECAARYAAAIRARPLRAEPAANVEDFVVAGRRVTGKRTWMLPLAAAAVLVIAIAIPLEMRRESRPAEAGPTQELHFRGSGIQTFAPAGTVDRDTAFVWSSGIAAARFRIEIGDATGRVYTTETDRSHLAMPAQLRSDVEYWWTVTALDERGHPLASSQRRTFAIRQ